MSAMMSMRSVDVFNQLKDKRVYTTLVSCLAGREVNLANFLDSM